MPVQQHSFLDGPYARLLAAVVFALVVASLLAMHWEEIFPSDAAMVATDNPVASCIAQRTAEIDQMIQENPQMSSRRETMLARLAPMCEDMAGKGAGIGPTLPRH